MNTTASPSIVAAERMADGIFIEFDDGKCAFYSAPLLYDCLPQAVAFNLSDAEKDAEAEG
ncbi:MAG: hypothetical protein WB608_13820 [Terracidiphilus sp.]